MNRPNQGEDGANTKTRAVCTFFILSFVSCSFLNWQRIVLMCRCLSKTGICSLWSFTIPFIYALVGLRIKGHYSVFCCYITVSITDFQRCSWKGCSGWIRKYHGAALSQSYVWNSASSELFVIGKSSLLAELGYTTEFSTKAQDNSLVSHGLPLDNRYIHGI